MNRVWVPLPDFKIYIEDYVKRLLDECKTKRIIIIGICTPSIELQQRSPLLAYNVEKYNSFYKDLSNKYKDKIIFINPLCNADKDLYVDGYHANKKGNDVVLESLVRVLNNTL